VRAAIIVAIGLVAVPLALNGAAYAGRWWVLRGQAGCAEPLPLPPRVAAFLAESVALGAAIVRFLSPGRRSTASCTASGGGDTVVLVPGFGLEAAAFAALEPRLRRSGWNPVTVKLPAWRLDLAASAESLERSLRALQSSTPVFALIAFGTGGLVARHYLRRQQQSGIRRLITLGTPHRGTEAAWCRFGRLRRLRPDTETLRDLSSDDPVPRQIDVIAIYSDFDALVVRAERAYYPGAFNIEIRGVGHFALARSRRVWELIEENLRAGREQALSPHSR
jgi:triacylglycerol lipase